MRNKENEEKSTTLEKGETNCRGLARQNFSNYRTVPSLLFPISFPPTRPLILNWMRPGGKSPTFPPTLYIHVLYNPKSEGARYHPHGLNWGWERKNLKPSITQEDQLEHHQSESEYLEDKMERATEREVKGLRESGDEIGEKVFERAVILLQQLQELVRLLAVHNPNHRSQLQRLYEMRSQT